MILGDANLEYSKVWDYAATIIKYNLGSTTKVKVTGIENPPPLFQRLYICLQACKESFMAGCRPILGVDGAHLRGPYPGILLTAIGKNGNQNMGNSGDCKLRDLDLVLRLVERRPCFSCRFNYMGT